MHMSSCEVNCRNLFLGQGITHHRGSSVARLQGVDHPSRRLADAAGNQQNILRASGFGWTQKPTTSTFWVYENMQLSDVLLKMPRGVYIIGKRGHTKKETRKRKGLQQTMPCDEAHFQACHVWWNFLEVVSTMSDGTHQSMASYRWKVGQQQSGGIRDWGWHGKISKKWYQDSISVDVVVFLLMSNDLDFYFHSTSFGFLFSVILSWFVQGQWLDVPNALWHGCWISRLLCDWRTPIVDWLDVLKLRMFCTYECCYICIRNI